MEPFVSLITLGVTDLRRSRAFYEDLLGWPVKAAPEDPNADRGFVAYELNNIGLALFPRDNLGRLSGAHAQFGGCPQARLSETGTVPFELTPSRRRAGFR
jgi:catechol 2,3-dioxygenase-like lactoylglutathione lyase family enzyme